LVVDDAVALRRTLALSLERAGFRVVQARDGREAIEQLQKNDSTNLVICDIEMPNMNGFDFLNYRRQNPQLSKIPVIMLTSRSNDKHRWLAMHLGATAYFTKPYIEQTFLRAIQDIISNQQSVIQNY
jgi:two-component system, chemotaxis family, sensor histidine kinase and response regulator PixL